MQTAATVSPEAMNRSAVLANLREEAARQEQDIADLERLQMTMSDYAKCLEACGVAADEESIMAASKDLLNYIETDWEREQREMMAEFQVHDPWFCVYKAIRVHNNLQNVHYQLYIKSSRIRNLHA